MDQNSKNIIFGSITEEPLDLHYFEATLKFLGPFTIKMYIY